MSAYSSMMRPGPSRDYYLKKRAEGMVHTQVLLALARRRVDVLWAMLRDNRRFTSAPPVTRAALLPTRAAAPCGAHGRRGPR